MRIARTLIVVMAAGLVLATLSVAFGRRPEAAAGANGSPSVRVKAGEVYLFAFFKGNGEDGLHLAESEDGLIWHELNGGNSLLRPAVGKDRLMRDPNITVGPDGLYHLVWTTSWHEPVIGHATSKDLINWSEQQSITPMTGEPDARNVWAPETFYDADSKQYLLFWATTIPGRFPETDQSGDNGLNHRLYLTTTTDFKTFAPARLFYDPGFEVIDATIVKEGKRFVMFFKDETKLPVAKKSLHYAVSQRAQGPYGKPSSPITGNYWAEGPTAIKIDRRWIVYFDKYREHRYGAVASRDLEHWEDISEQLQFPALARHGTVIRVPRAVLTKLLELK
ncbi:MAG TPA: glycoside hydrolase family 43 protein [Pyrinomonadaceae bacterium]|nr:glycoside hydrolase family 43 protein [Pyrinomonadaceae bacterium]